MTREIQGRITDFGLETWRVIEDNLDNLPLENFVSEIAKAGFDIKAELSRRPRLQKKFGENKGDLIWVWGLTDEVTEHAFEYSKGDVVRTPPPYELVEGRLFSAKFDAFVDDLTSYKEREGSVRRGLDKVQKELTRIPLDSFIIWSSPAGPLGFDNLEYDYSWTHIFWKEGIRVKYVSIRTDFSLEEHLSFIKMFLSFDKQLKTDDLETDTMKKIQQIMENPIIASPNDDINKLSDIGRVMKLTRPNLNIIYRDKQTGRTVYFPEVIRELDDIEQKRNFERSEIQNIIDFYQNRLLLEGLTEKDLIRIIGQYVLSLNYYFRQNGFIERMPYKAYSYDLLRQLQQVAGCAGGFKSPSNSHINGFRSYGKNASEASSEVFECPNCGQIAKGPVGNKCPNCGITKKEWVKKSGQKICD